MLLGMRQQAARQRSSGVNPVRLAIRASMRGPISSPSWKAKTKSGQPSRERMRCEVPRWRLTTHPIASKAERGPCRICETARGSRGNKKCVREIGHGLTRFYTVRENAKRERFGTINRFFPAGPIRETPRQRGNFRDPPAIVFMVNLHIESHAGTLHRQYGKTTGKKRTKNSRHQTAPQRASSGRGPSGTRSKRIPKVSGRSVKLFLDTSVLLAGCNSVSGMLGASCYGMPILSPSDFLIRERAAGRLR